MSGGHQSIEANRSSGSELIAPIFRVTDAEETAQWYRRLGFTVVSRNRFSPNLPLYMILAKGPVRIHLSEHAGDAKPESLVYFYVGDLDRIAAEFGVEVSNQPWAREILLVDPDGNRLRLGQRTEE